MERVEPDTSQWEGKRMGSAGEPVKDSETIWMIQNDSDGSTLAATEREVVTAGEATGLNQSLVLQCLLVALQDRCIFIVKLVCGGSVINEATPSSLNYCLLLFCIVELHLNFLFCFL